MVAVDNLSLTIEPGEFISLLGPSGCGKTTTLRILGGFEDPTSGAIYFGDQNVTELPPHKRDVNTVFQSYALFPHLNVLDNIAFGLRRKKVSKEEARRRAGEMLDLVDLAGRGERRPAQLSGGQQQRVALARALVNQPTLLLLDEPMSALDAKLRKHMQIELQRLQAQVGITFLYVTHDQEEAMTMSDRIVVMNQGRIEGLGSPATVYEQPTTEFVASFLGASNLLAGVLDRGATESHVNCGAVVLRAPSDHIDAELQGRAVKVGVRPEKIRIAQTASQSGDENSLPGRVMISTFTGVGVSYIVETVGGEEFTVYSQNLGGEPTWRVGDDVHMIWPVRHTFVVSPSENNNSQEVEDNDN
jgi:spermidine/putrescine transport system ATP-binding protein